MAPDRVGGKRALVYAAFAVLLSCQVFLGLWGVADQWTRGHNGWNGAAYHNGARNTLRWGEVFPLQYDTANVPPKKERLYTHAPLGLHLHNVVSVRVFGDRELSIRLVAAFMSIAALCMLFAVVQRLWSDAHGLLAAAVYVALPINAIYTNMANHSAGFIFWSELAEGFGLGDALTRGFAVSARPTEALSAIPPTGRATGTAGSPNRL